MLRALPHPAAHLPTSAMLCIRWLLVAGVTSSDPPGGVDLAGWAGQELRGGGSGAHRRGGVVNPGVRPGTTSGRASDVGNA